MTRNNKTGKKRTSDVSAENGGYRASEIALNPPSIYFDKPKSTVERYDDEGNFKKLNIPLDPTNRNSKTIERKVRLFGDYDTSPEAWVKWRMEFKEVINAYQLNDLRNKVMLANNLLKDSARDKFQQTHTRLEAENSALEERLSQDDLFEKTLEEVGKSYFPIMHAYRKQLVYMQHYLKLGKHTVRNFATRLRELNNYLPYFPTEEGRPKPSKLSDDELVMILNQAKPEEWQSVILGANIELYKFDFQGTVDYFEKLEVRQALEETRNKRQRTANQETTSKKSEDKTAKSKPKSGKFTSKAKCAHCGRTNHTTKDCWFSPDKKDKFKPGKTGKNFGKNVVMSKEQFNALITKLDMPKNPKAVKRKVRDEEADDSETDEVMHMFMPKMKINDVDIHNGSDHDFIYLDRGSSHNSSSDTEVSAKRQKITHKTTEVVGNVQGCDKNGIIRILFDTGASSTIILKDAIRGLTGPLLQATPTKWTTIGGHFVTKYKREINFKLPEFSTSKVIKWVCHLDMETPRDKAQYDMIIGADLLSELKIDLSYTTNRMTWEGVEIPMKEKHVISALHAAKEIYYLALETSILKEAEARQTRILDADYSALDLPTYVRSMTHLTTNQQDMLLACLNNYPSIFKGGLGALNIPPVHLELRPFGPNEKPYHARPFPVPKCFEDTTKKEIKRLCDIGVLSKCNDSEWAAPTFIQPKKTGDVRVLTDFRILNKFLIRKPYPLPKISDLLQKLEGFAWATALDLSMGYYHIMLDRQSSYLCTMILPWGKYRYLRLPMGLNGSPDIFQAIINDIMGDLANVRAYLDDILVTTAGSFEDHLHHVEMVLQRLSDIGFAVNLRKSKIAVTEIDYLGYYITRNGIQPQPKKVEAIMRLTPPSTKRLLRRFLGMINFYRDMWRRRSHTLAPLTALCSATAKYKWTDVEQKAFEDIKAIISRETLLAYPDFTKEFHIQTDSSDYQLGAVIMQDNKPLAFYSRKLNSAQKRYTTGEQELLSIVETLKEFKNILLGQKLIVHTDHKNLLYEKLSTDRMIRWRLLIEEFGPSWMHIKGETNVIADALSRLDANFDTKLPTKPTSEVMAYIFVTDKDIKETDFPLSPTLIAKYQSLDKELKRRCMSDANTNFSTKKVEGVEVITYNGKIYIPIQLQQRVVAWYHEYLAHPGESRTEATIRQTCTWKNMRNHVTAFCKTCRTCQLFKKQGKKYEHLPPKEAEARPWSRVNVD